MLLLAAHVPSLEIEAATVDHGLRAESADEAAMVARICAALGVRHTILPVVVAGGNLQAAARMARYSALGEWMMARGLDALATAHHVEDQAETLVMRLNRGSGLSGMAGIRARSVLPGSSDQVLLRPLLGFRRAELRRIVGDAGIEPVADPSNLQVRFDRVRARDGLARAPWLDQAAMARTAGHLADAQEALDWAADRAWTELVVQSGTGFDFTPAVPRAIAMRIIGRIVMRMGGQLPRGSAVAQLHDAMAQGRAMSLGPVVARPGKRLWRFRRAPDRKS